VSKGDFERQTAVVTGGAGQLGGRLAEALASRGASVAILDLREANAREAAEALREKHRIDTLGVACDVTDTASLAEARRAIRDALGPPTLLINAAGGNLPGATTSVESIVDADDLDEGFYGLSTESFRDAIDLNLLGTVLPCQVLTRDMAERGRGSVLNFSSMNAYRPLTRIPAYSAAKCGISNFTQWLAVHLAPRGVRVNALAPGFFLSEQLRYMAYDGDGQLTPRYRRVLDHTPMRRFGDPEELVGPAMFLLGPDAGFITGVTLPIDGGFSSYGGV
jgi:NAD(P)-dependent dehydrogenase (short-subunit alcohol dehydrogenase family)